jgi:hypothetical protein
MTFDDEPRNAPADSQRGGHGGPHQQFRVVVGQCRYATDDSDHAHRDQEQARQEVNVDHRLTGVLVMRTGMIRGI